MRVLAVAAAILVLSLLAFGCANGRLTGSVVSEDEEEGKELKAQQGQGNNASTGSGYGEGSEEGCVVYAGALGRIFPGRSSP